MKSFAFHASKQAKTRKTKACDACNAQGYSTRL